MISPKSLSNSVTGISHVLEMHGMKVPSPLLAKLQIWQHGGHVNEKQIPTSHTSQAYMGERDASTLNLNSKIKREVCF
jgi:hypothetical protein